jgi:imidazolonepropionase-like amidohydrolase
MTEQIGTVEHCKLADLVVLDADPLADISAVRQVHMVIKAGQPV